MVQKLTVHIHSFKSPPFWSTEANDRPLPTLAVADVLEVPAASAGTATRKRSRCSA